jgi:mannobiose 2-epimerase
MTKRISTRLVEQARKELLGNILPFWRRHAVDHQHGGFVGELSNDLVRKESASKGLILNARIMWTFAAAWPITQSSEDAELAERAFRYLQTHFHDRHSGGYYWELDASGHPINKNKKIYGQAFCLYALSEYYQSFGSRAALTAALEIMRSLESHARDAAHGGYWETLSENWKPCEDVRLSEKDPNEKKSMNNHLHLLEAYTNLLRNWPDSLVEKRLGQLIDLFGNRILDSSKAHFHHFFDEAWNVRSSGYTYGHDIEGSWLLSEAAQVLNHPETTAKAREMTIAIARAVLKEGLDADGGLFYEGSGGVVKRDVKEWWPQAEAVVGFLNAWQVTNEETFLEAAAKCWEFIQKHVVDHTHGEWFWSVSRDGTPDKSHPKVSMWKCPYHNGRACLEIIRRLEPPPTFNF